MKRRALRPMGATPIEISDYIKPIKDSKTITVVDVIKEYLTDFKTKTTLSEIKRTNAFQEPEGVKPDVGKTLQDVLDRIEKNPSEQFTMADVWYHCNMVYVFDYFNRRPSIKQCIDNLNFKNCLNWSALDTPATYIAKYKGQIILVSTKGGHRTGMVILSEADFEATMPGRVTYIGTLDYEKVVEYASPDHHYDSNKRNNQNSRDRLRSGVAAEDFEFKEVMKSLLDFKVYDEQSTLKEEFIELGFKQVTSWQSIKTSINENGYENTKYAVEKIIKYDENLTSVVSQSVETIANLRNKFGKVIQNVNTKEDVLDVFLKYYFNFHSQSDLRVAKETQANTFLLATMFNTWARKHYSLGRKSPIQSKHFNDVYEYDNDLPTNFNVRQLNGTA